MAGLIDIIGPVMIGPSSSHTAGAARIAKLALRLLGEPVKTAEIILYDSFAHTYLGHGTHLAVLGGLLGFAPDDVRLRHADALARESFSYTLATDEGMVHPNTVRLLLTGSSQAVEVVGVSLGGGRVAIVEIDGFPTHIDGAIHVIVVFSADRPGVITFLTSLIAGADVNIGNMSVSRRAKGDSVVMTIELDQPLKSAVLSEMLQGSGVYKIVQISP